MNKRVLCFIGGVILSISAAGLAPAQETPPTTTTTTTTTISKTVQNADGSFTVVEYPVNKEVVVNLTPTTMIPGASGRARVRRMADKTMIDLDLSGLSGDVTSYNLYAVDPTGRTTLLGPVAVNNGVATYSTTTPLNKFMLVLSPEANLSSVTPETSVVLRSAVPEGMAVVPYAQSGGNDKAQVGERVKATATTATSAYNVPLLGIPSFRRGTDTHMKVNFPSAGNSRANIFLEPRKDGPTQIKMRFHSLMRAPANKRLVLWAVGPDNTYVRLGQVINTGGRNEAEIKTETNLPDFGLFVTLEDTADSPQPGGPIFATVAK